MNLRYPHRSGEGAEPIPCPVPQGGIGESPVADVGIQTRFRPSAPDPIETQPPFLTVLSKMRKDPLSLQTREMMEKPACEVRLLGLRAVFLSDPNLIRYVFARSADNYGMDPLRRALARPMIGDSLITNEGAEWKEARRVSGRYFTAEWLAKYAQIFRAVSERACADLDTSSKIEIGVFIKGISFENVAEAFCSAGSEITSRVRTEDFSDAVELQLSVDPADLMNLPRCVPRLSKLKAIQLAHICAAFGQTFVLNRIRRNAQSESSDDLLEGFVRHWDPQRRQSKKAIRKIQDNLAGMLGAGFEMAAVTITWALYFLLNCPRSMANVRAELGTCDYLKRPPTEWQYALPWLTASIRETMRLYPNVPCILRYAKHPDSVGGFEIQPGDYVVANVWAQNRNPDRWPDPKAFLPERFLRRADGGCDFQPFGVGPRACIGGRFAMIEAVVVLATVLSRFDFELVDSQDIDPVWRGTLRPSRPIRAMVSSIA